MLSYRLQVTEIFDDIKKLYLFSLPHPDLAPYIEWFSESSPQATLLHTLGTPFSIGMFPSWTPTIWINLGKPYQLLSNHQWQNIDANQDLLILRDTPTTRYNHPSDHIFTVKFFPGGLESILGINQTKFAGRVAPLREILPASLISQVKTARESTARQDLLEAFFLQSMKGRRPKDHYLHLVSHSIATYKTDMQYNTSQLAERCFVSAKTINRYFHNTIGLSPKKYFSLLRARTALSAFLADKPHFSPTDYGYYDMSHFYSAAASFTGRPMSPASTTQ